MFLDTISSLLGTHFRESAFKFIYIETAVANMVRNGSENPHLRRPFKFIRACGALVFFSRMRRMSKILPVPSLTLTLVTNVTG